MINKKKDVIELESKLNSIEAELKSNDAFKFNQRITELWQYIKEREADEKLKNMPIDTISSIEKGLPVNQLINAGYQTVYDVSRFTVNQFLSVKGIGDKSAQPLKSSVEKIKQSVHIGTAGRINPDDLTRLDYDALEAIYLKHHILIENEHILKDIQNFRADFQKDFDSVKEQGNFIVSLFQSKEKKDKIQQSIQSLNDRNVTGRFKDIEDAYLKVINFKVDEQTLKADFIANNIKYYSEIESLTGQTNKKDAEDIPSELVEAVNAVELNTEGLDLTLRHYQAFGAKYMLYSKRVLLGDEMGLGKTVQALAVLNHLNHDGKQAFIVVCPLSVVANWKRETEKFTKLNALIYHGKDRDHVFKQWQEEKGILITTFSHTRNIDKNAVDHLDALIVDEAHYIKNPEAKRSISVYELAEKAEYVSFMSGTPMENRLEEMKQLISVLQENIADKISNELHLLEPKKFKREVAAVYLRRNRADVLGELPELEIIEQWSDFGQEEQVLYNQAVENGQVMMMRRAAWQGGSPDKSPKLDALREICEAARENGHKVLVFSFFRDVIETIQEHLTGQTFPAITGDVPNSDRQKIVDDFTSAEPGAVMVSQITAGGVGLNIQAANIIVLCEPQWKPSTEEQAISRAYRMGQSRNVMVYRLLTEDSIDGSMLEVLAEKSQLFNDYARESEVANIAQETEEISEASLTQKVLEMEKERLAAKEAVS
ncbi:Helicase conserved C-terminal domain-containing protein [Jeotgalicoccus aerolatus]|uniref:Helicase conserved C-terminal domain-containing protein n=1 Tax=Jeotgalicoccus aerolatus TaxID=709510 RepID=A0A1G9ALB5_9STAP|nr:SNF2-related protein [Jeotgalicoccus aerolatus]SDK27305.1 Helicase conserved C-terminal domain-containing protein [Jeotgalicoccus aerolatus]